MSKNPAIDKIMIYAMVKGKKQLPLKGQYGECPHCKGDVIAKCGEVRKHHWAHRQTQVCDNWKSNESEWHIQWKLNFDISCTEVGIRKNGVYHIADVLTYDGVVIEFQNSPMTMEVLAARESFYDKIIWVINGAKYQSRITVGNSVAMLNKIPPSNFRFNENAACWVLNLGRSYSNKTSLQKIQRLCLKLGMAFDWSKKICTISEDTPYKTWSKSFVRGLYQINQLVGIKNLQNGVKYFEWKFVPRAWRASRCPLFLDMGDGQLFWIRNWLGGNHGELTEVSISKFLNKYAK